MKILADTSVLVPALVREHPHHDRAAPVVQACHDRAGPSLSIAAHALAETYATLTALPLKPRISPARAVQMMGEGVLSIAEVVALDADDYRTVLDRLVSLGLVSGAVYDGLHVRAAEKAGADELVTFNGRDFRRMPPEPPCRLVVL